MSMNLLRLFRGRNASAPVARERLQILLAHERGLRGQPDLLAHAAGGNPRRGGRHVVLDPDKVIVKLERGKTVSTLEVDIEVPNNFDKSKAAARDADGRLREPWTRANRSPAELPVGCGGHPFPASNEPEASCSAAHRRLLLRRDPLRDRVVSAAALQLQLHGLRAASGSAFALNMPVATADFHISERRREGMAPRVAVGRGRHVMVLRRVWRQDLRRAAGTAANHEPSRRNA